jgi:hypothetical protein
LPSSNPFRTAAMCTFFTKGAAHSLLPYKDSFCCTLPFMLQFILHISVLGNVCYISHMWTSDCHSITLYLQAKCHTGMLVTLCILHIK